MRNSIYIFIITILLSACGSAKKYLDQGDYATAVYKAVQVLQRNDTKEKHILALKEAYPKANEKDLKKINQLKLEGDPKSWDKIYNIYKGLDSRQELVKTVAPLHLNGREIDFEYKNYLQNMAESKLRAAQFYYNKAKDLMQNDDQQSNRQAYQNLQKVKTYFSTYEDTDDLMKEAKYMGTSKALISIQNKSEYNFSRAYLAELINFGIADLNSDWKNYYTNYNEDINYDYDVVVTLRNVKFSEALRETTSYEDKKTIRDGWEYVLDEKGNVKKDTLGNDIKKEKYKTITCKVIKETQKKSLDLVANIKYINKITNQVLKTSTVNSAYKFSHVSATARGNMNALSKRSTDLIKRKPVAFPANEEMIDKLKPDLKNKIKEQIKADRNYIK